MLPRIAITMGDPAGVGPEICLRLLHETRVREQCLPLVIGDAAILHQVGQELGLPIEAGQVAEHEWQSQSDGLSEPTIIDLPCLNREQFQPGRVSAETGHAAYTYIDFAINAALTHQVDAVTTGPIHKEAFAAAGIPFPGHTELFAHRAPSPRHCMMLTCDELTCSFVTTHIGLRDVCQQLSIERILEVIQLSHECMRHLRNRIPKLVVCGLNPHAGEHGLFGDREEERLIEPAIRLAAAEGIQVEGPVPPDTAFLPERRRETDCFICMYHDQGHIPLKALAFDVAVNVTLGLPLIRTSVDHGTALDIAWQGVAKPTSLREAVRLAARLAAGRSSDSVAISHHNQ